MGREGGREGVVGVGVGVCEWGECGEESGVWVCGGGCGRVSERGVRACVRGWEMV